MLKVRPNCENCNTDLPFDSKEAMICSFECTYCSNCVSNILHNICPNCEGSFTKRSIRPAHLLEKHPVSTERIYNPVDKNAYIQNLKNTP